MSILPMIPRIFQWGDYLRLCSMRHEIFGLRTLENYLQQRVGGKNNPFYTWECKFESKNYNFITVSFPIPGEKFEKCDIVCDDNADRGYNFVKDNSLKKINVRLEFKHGENKVLIKLLEASPRGSFDGTFTYSMYKSYFSDEAMNAPYEYFNHLFVGETFVLVGALVKDSVFDLKSVGNKNFRYLLEFVLQKPKHTFNSLILDPYDDITYIPGKEKNYPPDIPEDSFAYLDQIVLAVTNSENANISQMGPDRMGEFTCRLLSRGIPHVLQLIDVVPYDFSVEKIPLNLNEKTDLQNLFRNQNNLNRLRNLTQSVYRAGPLPPPKPIVIPKKSRFVNFDLKEAQENHLLCSLNSMWMKHPIFASDNRVYERKFLLDYMKANKDASPVEGNVTLDPTKFKEPAQTWVTIRNEFLEGAKKLDNDFYKTFILSVLNMNELD